MKKCSNYHTVALVSHSSKVILKILQARLQQYVEENSQMCKLDFRKDRETEIKLPTLLYRKENKGIPEKHLLLLH